MTSLQANYLVAIMMCGNFRDAAKSLFVTPSTISQSMSALEGEYGAKILLRTRGGIVLTPLGEKLYPIAQNIVRNFQQADALKNSGTPVASDSPSIDFAVSGTGLRRCLKEILPEYLLAENPPHFTIHDATFDSIRQTLGDDRIRFALISAPSSYCRAFSEEYSCQIITRTNMMLRVGKDNPLFRNISYDYNPLSDSGAYTLADLSTYNFVFPSEHMLQIMEEQIPTFPWKKQTLLVSSDISLLNEIILKKNAVAISFDDHLFPRANDGTVFIPLQMGHHYLNLHTFAVAKDIKNLTEAEQYIISEIRRSLFR